MAFAETLPNYGGVALYRYDSLFNPTAGVSAAVKAEIAKQHGIEWEQKGTHEEHLDVYNFKKKERKKEVQLILIGP